MQTFLDLCGCCTQCCRKLLEQCEEDRQAGKLKNYDIKISIVFIYLEKISDLLTTEKKTKELKCGNIPGGLGWGVPEANRFDALYTCFASTLTLFCDLRPSHCGPFPVLVGRIPCLDYAEIEKNLDLSEKRKFVVFPFFASCPPPGFLFLLRRAC